MRPYRIAVPLLALLVLSVQSLPLNTPNSDEISNVSGSDQNESDETLVQTRSNEQQSETDELVPESNESANDDENSALTQVDSIEENEDESEKVIFKRSPDIPDPELYQPREKAEVRDTPNVHPTHDEYQEWKSQLPRYRRDSQDDDDLSSNDWDVQLLVENSLEDYAQGCEFMEENSDENNETTYNEYRRKRDADKESEPADEEDEDEDEEDSKSEPEQTELDTDSESVIESRILAVEEVEEEEPEADDDEDLVVNPHEQTADNEAASSNSNESAAVSEDQHSIADESDE